MIKRNHERLKAMLDQALKDCIREATETMTPTEILIEAMNYRNTPAVRQALWEHGLECGGIDLAEVRREGSIGCQIQ